MSNPSRKPRKSGGKMVLPSKRDSDYHRQSSNSFYKYRYRKGKTVVIQQRRKPRKKIRETNSGIRMYSGSSFQPGGMMQIAMTVRFFKYGRNPITHIATGFSKYRRVDDGNEHIYRREAFYNALHSCTFSPDDYEIISEKYIMIEHRSKGRSAR